MQIPLVDLQAQYQTIKHEVMAPYEDFSQKDRQANHSIGSANKAVEVLRRILQVPPAMLGVVLPRVFMNGQSYRQIKSQINTLYNNITLVELPPIFNFAEVETVLLWYGRLQRIWNELTPLPKLGSIAEIHTGVQYNISLRENEDTLFSDVPRDGFAKGLRRVTDDFEPYVTIITHPA